MHLRNSIFEHNAFRWNYLSQTFQNVASWIYIISENYLVVSISKSGLFLGITTALYWGPMVILGMYGGVVSDRLGRRNLLFLCQSVMAIAAILMSILTGIYELNIYMIWSFTLLFGVINSFHYPTMQSIPRELVPLEKLPNAVALNGSIPSVGRMIGPVAGGIIIYTYNSSLGFAISGIMLILSVALIVPVYNTKPEMIRPGVARREILEGLNYLVSSNSMIRIITAMTLIFLTVYHFQVILPIVSKSLYDYNSMTYGILMSSFGFGSFAGSMFLSKMTHKLNIYFRISLLSLAAGLTSISLVNSTIYALFFAMCIGFSANLFSGISSIWLHEMTSDTMRSRVMAVYSISYLGTGLVGGPIIGLLMSEFGLLDVAVAQAFICASVALAFGICGSNRPSAT